MVRGFLHEPGAAPSGVIAIFHGAGGNCQTPLIVAAAEAFAKAGWLAFRGDLPYRQLRPKGSPIGKGERDREGIRRAAEELRKLAAGVPFCLAGHSYGGRQCSMVVAEEGDAAEQSAAQDSAIAAALLLLSYPLHPPGQPAKARTEHLPKLRVPTVFVHGTRDAFGSIEELEAAIRLIPAKTALHVVERAGHGVPPATAASFPAWLSAIMS